MAKHTTDLTARQIEVLCQVSKGLAHKEIAQALGISQATVKNHVCTILLKLGAANRAQAVALAYEKELLLPNTAPTKDDQQKARHRKLRRQSRHRPMYV